MMRNFYSVITCFLVFLCSFQNLTARSIRVKINHSCFIYGVQHYDHIDSLNTDSIDATPLKRSGFQISTQFLTDNVYLGRSDTGHNFTYLPSLTYTDKSGLFIVSSLYFTPGKSNSIDGLIIQAGYHTSFSDNFSGSLSFEKTLFAEHSTAVKSVISSEISASLDYDLLGIISPSINIDYNINRQGITNDLILNTGISHDFFLGSIISSKDFLAISPAIEMNTGSQNFNDANFEKIKNFENHTNVKDIKNKRSTPLTPAQLAYNDAITKAVGQDKKFQLLDYEFSLPLNYSQGRFKMNLTPTLSLPYNMLKKQLQQQIGERSNRFSLILGLSYWL